MGGAVKKTPPRTCIIQEIWVDPREWGKSGKSHGARQVTADWGSIHLIHLLHLTLAILRDPSTHPCHSSALPRRVRGSFADRLKWLLGFLPHAPC